MALRELKPARRDIAAKLKYTDYREDLRTDFNGCCGYCDDSDAYTDSICFHIDHFAPKSQFAELETSYANLIYACRFCNMRKSYHWIGLDSTVPNDGSRGFVDPCDDQYDDHLERTAEGAIVSKTVLGRYMVNRLNLHLIRHQVLWNSRRARKLREEIDPLIERFKQAELPKSEAYIALLERYIDLTREIERYEGLALGR